ncbi:MAG: hypothetical protein IJ610_00510 [Bacteroidaceae bacterium]|nr:hypothetical protein [Bacteroidaceae bacterium]
MANYSLEIGNALNAAWEYAKKYGLLIAVIYLLMDLLTGGLDQISGPSVNQEAYRALGEAIGRQDWESAGSIAQSLNTGFPVGGIIGAILKLIVSVGLYNLALGLMAGRFSEVTFDAFKLPFATYLKVFVVNLITGIIVFVSTLCCIIPVFFVAPRIIFAPVYQVEHPEAGIFESICASWNMSSGNTFSLLGLGFIIVGIAIVGFCCCCIGIFFAEAIELFALTAAYYQLKGNLQ